jgi:hypothetical protein
MQTFEQILNRVRDKSDKAARKGHQIWFRGQANATWPVKSSLHRYIESYSKFGVKPDQKLLLEVAKSFYHRFAAEAWPLLQYGQRDPWGVVFMMQHHDVPTRLLDWTASFGCALYFALGNLSSESPAIENAAVYMLIAEELNQRSIKKSGIVFLEEIVRDAQTAFTWPYHPCAVRTQVVETISVSPVLDNARMVAQQSRFLLCGLIRFAGRSIRRRFSQSWDLRKIGFNT